MSSPSIDRRLGLTGNKAYKAPCDIATTANVTLSGEQVIDGTLTSSSRVLVWVQNNNVDNGIWDTSTGSWSRAIDCNTNQDIAKGTQVLVTGGTSYAGQIFEFTSANPIIPGTSAITIVRGISSSTLEARLASMASAADGAGLSGFDGTKNYAAKTIGWAANGLEVDPRWFGFKGDWNGTTGTDDTTALQAAINWIPSGGAGTIKLPRNSNCSITAQINIGSRNILLEGNQATVTLTANVGAGYLFNVGGTNCEFRNFSVNRKTGVTAASAFFVTGLQHVFRNITSRNQDWDIVFYCQDMKESHFSEIRVDLDVAGKTGKIFHIDYCVNNTMSDSFIGFCDQAIFGSSTAQPTFGYHTEGLMITNVIIVYANKAVNVDNGTFIAISNCCFDFITSLGVFISNGGNNVVSNTWIAANANSFLGVGSLSGVSGMQVIGCTFQNSGAFTSCSAVSLSGPSALVVGNFVGGGVNGGAVTQASSQVIGNSVTGGGTNFSASSSAATILGSLAVAGALTAGSATSITASVSGVLTGVATTLYTLPNAAAGMYIVSSNIGTQGDAANFGAYAVIANDAGTARIVQQTNAPQQTLTLAGLAIQTTQTSGSTKNAVINLLKIL